MWSYRALNYVFLLFAEIVGTIGAAATIWILFLILAIILGIYICVSCGHFCLGTIKCRDIVLEVTDCG